MRKKIIVRGPALSRSGYGEQTRFALRSLRKFEDRFDIYFINTNWGATSWLADDNEERRWIDFLIHKTLAANNQPNPSYDMSIQVTIPNEWEKMAPLNIGFTAGIETDRIAPIWIEKANMMDKVFVVSNNSKDSFKRTTYEAVHKVTGQKYQDWKCETPVIVTNFPVRDVTPKELQLDIASDFNFLVVAQDGPRKNLKNTIEWFIQEFKDDPAVGMVLKIFGRDTSTMDRHRLHTKIEGLLANHEDDIQCKIYLLHGEMTDEELHGLYTHPQIKCLVNIAHGEGFGLPIFEAVCSGLPVLTTEWGGQLDFLYAPVKKKNKKTKMRPHFCKVAYDFLPVQPEAVWEGVIHSDFKWTYTKEGDYKHKMRDMIKNHKSYVSRAKKLKTYVLKDLRNKVKYSLMQCVLQRTSQWAPQILNMSRRPG
jgi:glycosyltransferase involved in cell wall biosynthesis